MTTTTLLLSVVVGAAIGLSLGMLGGGGSILTVPALVYLLGQDTHIAVSTSLVIVGLNAGFGAALHQRAGTVRLRAAATFGAAGLAAAFIGARLSKLVPEALLLVLFALLMLVVATLMLRGASPRPSPAVTAEAPVWWRIALAGSGVGFLTGFLGVGGGFLIVPALVLVLGMSMREAVGSSLVVIVINTFAALLGHFGEPLNWPLILLLVAGGVAGSVVGSRTAHRVPAARLRMAFAVLVMVLGAALLVANVPRLFA